MTGTPTCAGDQAIRAVDFDGVLIPDHIPMMGNDYRIGAAYTIGYMKALVSRANAEAGAHRVLRVGNLNSTV
jgi:hypothetical protein